MGNAVSSNQADVNKAAASGSKSQEIKDYYLHDAIIYEPETYKMLDDTFKKLDANGDGTLDSTDLYTGTGNDRKRKRESEVLATLSKYMDFDGSGCVDDAEFKYGIERFVCKWRKLTVERQMKVGKHPVREWVASIFRSLNKDIRDVCEALTDLSDADVGIKGELKKVAEASNRKKDKQEKLAKAAADRKGHRKGKAFTVAKAGKGFDPKQVMQHMFQEETKEDLRKLFKDLDTDGDKSLTVKDFTAPMVSAERASRTADLWETLQTKLDFDKNGEISEEEFLLGCRMMAGDTPLMYGYVLPADESYSGWLAKMYFLVNANVQKNAKSIQNQVQQAQAA